MSKKQKSWEDQGPRMRGPRQGVGLWQKVSPEDHVKASHPARMIWRLVCGLNWKRYEERIQSRPPWREVGRRWIRGFWRRCGCMAYARE